MLRITTGSAKNKKLKVPTSTEVKPVQEVVKLAIFAILTPQKVENAECLDVFAGSGNLGIEALSRGARSCDFVDQFKSVTDVIAHNLKDCNLEEKANIFTEDSVKFVANTERTYDIIFVDPPYNDLKHRFLMKNLDEILNSDGFIAFTYSQELDMEKQIEDTGLKIITQRKYGKTILSMLSH